VESYLDHQASKLIGRFDANSYLVLSRAMDHHDIGRNRGGIGAALGRVTSASTVIAIDSDRLYPPRLQHEIAALLPGRPEIQIVNSLYGHDAFLIESAQVGAHIEVALKS
jgi:homoserine O-acetyltransferase